MSVNSVTLLGTLTAGPQGTCEGGFPSGLLQVQFGLAGSCPGAGTKSAARKFWTNVDVNSPSPAFVTLDGIGAGQSVTRVHTLYLRSTALMKLRATFLDPAGGPDIVAIVPVQGLWIGEFPSLGALKLLESQGVGGIEFAAFGDQ